MAVIKKTVYNDDEYYVPKEGEEIFGPKENINEAYSATVQAQIAKERSIILEKRANEAYALAQAAGEDAIAAMISADGKNMIFHSAITPPGTDYILGDTWFNSAENYAMYKWDGQQWVKEEFGAEALANLSITNAKIANGTIQSAKIAGLDVGKLTGGYIDAVHIDAQNLTIGQNTLGSVLTGMANDIAGKADSADIPTWYTGTGITGDSLTPTIFSGSGVSDAIVGDMYLNDDINYTYRCTTAGGPNVARWVFVSKIQGADGKGISSITLISTSGNLKTYRITYTDNTYYDYSVADGVDVTSRYVTYINDIDGVRVANSANPSSYGIFNSNGMQVYSGGYKYVDIGSEILLGRTDGNQRNIRIRTSDGMSFRNGTTKFGSLWWWQDTSLNYWMQLGLTGIALEMQTDGTNAGSFNVVTSANGASTTRFNIGASSSRFYNTLYDKSNNEIKGMTSSNITTALGYTPPSLGTHSSISISTTDINIGGISDKVEDSVNCNYTSGFTPRCVVGWENTGGNTSYMNIYRLCVNQTQKKIYYSIRNIGSSAFASGSKITVYVLCDKNS